MKYYQISFIDKVSGKNNITAFHADNQREAIEETKFSFKNAINIKITHINGKQVLKSN